MPPTRVERATFPLRRGCSTTKLKRLDDFARELSNKSEEKIPLFRKKVQFRIYPVSWQKVDIKYIFSQEQFLSHMKERSDNFNHLLNRFKSN